MQRPPLFLTLAFLWASCGPTTDATSAPGLSASIVDGAHSGNAHFYWLPPLVPAPSPTAVFDGTLSPVVTIAEGAAGSAIAEFTMTTGSGSETVRVDPAGEHYIVNWHTDLFNLSDQVTYRIRVRVGGTELGHADVDVVSSGRELKNVDTQQFLALVDGRTLPIKFRIEQGALPEAPSIQPSAGEPGTLVTITDPQGRIEPGSAVIFYKLGQDPATQGTDATNIQVTSLTTVTFLVPSLALGGPNLVSVRPNRVAASYFSDLTFLVQ
jgi:hypothetical protein